MSKRKFEAGDRVVVHGKEGRGEGVVQGVDLASGMVQITYTKLEHEGKVHQGSAEGYAPPGQLTRE